jgi:hypothetical protein
MERLEHTYMKHVVDAGAVGEPKMVGDGANAFNHLERASKLRVDLASRPRQQGLSRAAKDPQLDPVVDGEL